MDKITNYDVILSQTTLVMIIAYKNALLSNTTKPGAHLNRILNDERVNLEQTSNEAFIQLLLWTKQPMIFAESEVVGDGTDWNTEELRILGDLSIAMKVSQIRSSYEWDLIVHARTFALQHLWHTS